jgi:hypothetical protein
MVIVTAKPRLSSPISASGAAARWDGFNEPRHARVMDSSRRSTAETGSERLPDRSGRTPQRTPDLTQLPQSRERCTASSLILLRRRNHHAASLMRRSYVNPASILGAPTRRLLASYQPGRPHPRARRSSPRRWPAAHRGDGCSISRCTCKSGNAVCPRPRAKALEPVSHATGTAGRSVGYRHTAVGDPDGASPELSAVFVTNMGEGAERDHRMECRCCH